ncbi:MAG: hypothetical protein K8R08_08255 [Methanosarcinales archaeon]|nr:hypothetical protein [Methanosarcinales archaeon]
MDKLLFEREIKVLDDKVSKYEKMLELLIIDTELLNNGYELFYIIDFSELYRYMYPNKDRIIKRDPDRFWWEQIAIRYFLEVSDYNIILLKPYFDEFKYVLRNNLNSLVIHASAENLRKKLFDDQAIWNYIERIKECLEKDDSESIEELYKEIQRKHLMDFDLDSFECFNNIGTKALHDLLKQKRIFLLSSIKNEDININLENLDFGGILTDIEKERPEDLFLENNRTDARALAEIVKLNEQNLNNKKIFLLVSSTEILYNIFINTKSKILLDEHHDVSIYRDLYYIMLKMYYDFYPEIKKDVEGLINLIKRLRILIKKIESENLLGEESVTELFPLFKFHDIIEKLEYYDITNLYNEISTAKILKDAPDKKIDQMLIKLCKSFVLFIEDQEGFKKHWSTSITLIESEIKELEKSIMGGS